MAEVSLEQTMLILLKILPFSLSSCIVLLCFYYLWHLCFSLVIICTQNASLLPSLAIMTCGFLLFTIPVVQQEVKGNPKIAAMGINARGNMEGKEVRFGAFYSGFYCGENIAIPAGTAVGVHDSFMPLSGVCMLMAMNIDAFFGGLGTGWINMFIFLIVSLFIGSLMIGRTPEIFGKKIGIQEVQITVSVTVLQGLVPLALASIACFTYTHVKDGNEALHWLSNTGAHGFTTMLYEYISSVAGNGSEFGGLGNNTVFWNLTTSVAMLTGRFIPIIGAISIAGCLIREVYAPRTTGTIKIQGFTFGAFLFFVIIVLNVLSLLPALVLGPVSDHLLLHK